MWIHSQFIVLCFLCISTILAEQGNNGETGGTGVKRKNKRIVQDVKFQNNLYDQVAQESDHSSSSLNAMNNGNGNGNGEYYQNSNNVPTHVSQSQYGMKLSSLNSNNNKARNPRAEPNYLRSYHYSSRGDSPPQSSGGWNSGNYNDGRQMSSFSLGGLQGASSAPSDYVFGDGDDNSVAAGGHGHQSHGHGWGHGGGGGGGGGGHGHGKDCNSALGLLGVLGLASYLQNVLRQMSTTAAGRRRRDTDTDYRDPPRDTIIPTLLPLLIAISHARDGKVPIKCGLRPYCLANSFLTKHLAGMGRPVCEQLEKVMEASIEGGSNLELKPKWRRTKALRDLRLAARSGIKGRNCWKLYPSCPQLERMTQNSTNYDGSSLSTFAGFHLSF